MATNVGDLVVKLGADTREFEQAMNRATGPGSALASLGAIARNAAITAGVAIAGFSAKGTADFMKLDQGMREVFTLLPGISEQAMDDMTAEVLAFSTEFGKLPDEVVPALYQALSAGVPPDNVFAFLETANMAAVGGVSDLTTAVDALTSVTNAYGRENLSAGEASDALFTAIRLGKTTMDELGANVSRVAPIAASLGVNFDDVAAAMAAVTAQGVPTNEAATQLRSLLNELSDSTSGAGQAFADITGQTFPEFIAGGGDLETALQALATDAEANGLRMTDVFSSIEASMGATVLTSESGSDAFGVAMDAMAEKSGATETAFETMDEGIQASWNRLTAGFNVLTTEVGEKLAPMFQEGVDWVVETGMPALRDGVMEAFERIGEFTNTLKDLWERFQTDSDGYFANVRTYVIALRDVAVAAFKLIESTWTNVLKPAWEAIEPLVMGILNTLGPFIATAFEAIEGVLNSLSALMRGDFKTAWEEMSGAVETITTGLETVLKDLWNAIETFLGERFDAIKQAATDRWNEMSASVEGITEGLETWIQEKWNGIKEWLGTLFGNIATNAGIHWDGVVDEIKGAFDGLKDWAQGIFDDVVGVIGGALDSVISRITDAWNRVTSLFGRAESAEERAADAAANLAATEQSMRDAQAADAARRAAEGSTDTPPGSTSGPGGGIRLPHEGGNLPGLALGGLVTAPMRALIGEAGPELVTPLDRVSEIFGKLGGGGNQTIIVELDGNVLMRSVAPRMVDTLRLKTGLAGL